MTLPTCRKARGASRDMPPETMVIVGGHKAIDPETNKVSPVYKANK